MMSRRKHFPGSHPHNKPGGKACIRIKDGFVIKENSVVSEIADYNKDKITKDKLYKVSYDLGNFHS